MRFQGKITHWNDDKGFGFITPNGGGQQVFVHIKSFTNRQRRPTLDRGVIYELKTDAQGRPQAENVICVGDNNTMPVPSGQGKTSLVFAAVFLALVAAVVLAGKLPHQILALYLIVSIVTFVAYAFDKSAALNGRWRTQERTLHLFGLVGGWPGALVAQKLLRHKSKKQSFQFVFWGTVIVNCSILGWLLTPPGAQALHSLIGIL